MTEFKKYIAELFGTFVLVFMGCGSAVIAGDQIGNVGISFAFGLAVLSMVYAIGHVSGCHINPAVTVAMMTAKKMEPKEGVIYIASQCIGAILGAAILLLIAIGLPGYSIAADGLGQNGFDAASPAGYGIISAFIAEVFLTMVFLFAIFGSTHKNAPKGTAGIAIGFALVLVHLVGIPITGTSVNPARSLGPAIFVGGTALIQLWLFWVAPIIGGVLAAIIWKYALGKEFELDKQE
ncbi:MAG: aquaporin [Promethearchaeota archaeon]|nr:MAG: aquaporin [Candidatus Lokiarchaeota archaeon]